MCAGVGGQGPSRAASMWEGWEYVHLGCGSCGRVCNLKGGGAGEAKPVMGSCLRAGLVVRLATHPIRNACLQSLWVSAGGHVGRAWGGKGANLVASASDHHVSSLRMFKN